MFHWCENQYVESVASAAYMASDSVAGAVSMTCYWILGLRPRRYASSISADDITWHTSIINDRNSSLYFDTLVRWRKSKSFV